MTVGKLGAELASVGVLVGREVESSVAFDEGADDGELLGASDAASGKSSMVAVGLRLLSTVKDVDASELGSSFGFDGALV